jgi:hypothetical protein
MKDNMKKTSERTKAGATKIWRPSFENKPSENKPSESNFSKN